MIMCSYWGDRLTVSPMGFLPALASYEQVKTLAHKLGSLGSRTAVPANKMSRQSAATSDRVDEG